MGKSAVAFLALVLLPSTAAATPPIVSDEIIVDHGFRYPERVDGPERVALGIQDSTLLFVYGDKYGESISGYRRSQDGVEIDINGSSLGPNEVGRRCGPFDLDDFDGVGWKLAYLTDHDRDFAAHGLRVRNLDPVSLKSNQSDLVVVSQAAAILSYPTTATAGDSHVLVWSQSDNGVRNLELMRFNRNLEPLDSGPREIATNLADATIALAMSPDGGILIWIDRGSQVMTLALSPSGLPEGDPQVIDSANLLGWPELTAVGRLGRGWLVAWWRSDHPAAARLDSLGNILPPGIFELPGEMPTEGLAVAGSDTLALITWRPGWFGERSVVAARVDSAGRVLDPAPIALSTDASYDNWDAHDPRNLDCATIGGRFVVLWDVYEPFYGAESKTRGTAQQTLDSRVLAQWIDSDGSIFFPEAILVSQASRPSACAVETVNDRYVLVERDDASADLYLHAVVLDSTGAEVGQPIRKFSPVRDGDGFSGSLQGLKGLSWGANGALVYGYREYFSSDWIGTYYDNQYLFVDRIGPDGSTLRRVEMGVGTSTESASSPELFGFNAAGTENAVLAAYAAARGNISEAYIRAELIPVCGRLLHYWRIDSPGPDIAPAVAPLGDKFLIVWDSGPLGGQVLQSAILDPADLRTAVEGEPLISSFGSHGTSTLIRGPDQVLCTFPARLADDDLGYDIYAVRIDRNGIVLDSTPIALCMLPGDQGAVQGVWDGRHYIVVFSNPGQSSGIFGNRMGLDGTVLDGNGFAIANGVGGPLSIASAGGLGNSMIAYNGDRIRLIRDDPSIEGGGTPDSAHVVAIDAVPSRLRVGVLSPNPARGSIRADFVTPAGAAAEVLVMDVSGRRLLTRTIDAGVRGRTEIWDGRLSFGDPAPTGIYFIRVSAGHNAVVRSVLVLR